MSPPSYPFLPKSSLTTWPNAHFPKRAIQTFNKWGRSIGPAYKRLPSSWEMNWTVYYTMRGTKLQNPLFCGKEKKFLIPQWKWYQWTRTDLSISVIHFFFVLGGPIKNVHEKTAKIDQKWYFMLNNFILLVIMLFFFVLQGSCNGWLHIPCSRWFKFWKVYLENAKKYAKFWKWQKNLIWQNICTIFFNVIWYNSWR